MRLIDYLDKGASLNPDAPCLTMTGRTRSYGAVQRLSCMVARALDRSGVGPGDKVAVLSGTDPVAFSCVFGIARAGAIWCPVDAGNGADDTRDLLGLLEVSCLIFQRAFAPLVERMAADLPRLTTIVCLDGETTMGTSFRAWLDGLAHEPFQAPPGHADDVVMIAGTAGTTGRPKAVQLTARNIETMVAQMLMSYPFDGRPVYLSVMPLTHRAGFFSIPVLALGGEIVLMPVPDPGELTVLVAEHRVTHAFMLPTLIYSLLDHPALPAADLSSLQCLWYGAVPMSPSRLAEAVRRIGPVLGQLFGQTEVPLTISTMGPPDHVHADGSLALERFASAGRPTPLTTVAIMDEHGALLPRGGRGEIVVRGPLVMSGYYRDEAATAEASRFGWHHTGDIGYLDEDNYLYIVDRAQDVIISGGFSVYSAEVEQALRQHPAVLDAAVVGVPDTEWGERVAAVIQPRPGSLISSEEMHAFALSRLGSIKAPAHVEVWADMPRSRIGRVLKGEVRARLTG
jgi:fatty-acyl-CoA synthase